MTANKPVKEERTAGKEHVLCSNPDGIDLFRNRTRRPGMIHDNRYVPGWNK